MQAFRRSKNEEPTRTFSLGGLNPEAKYRITNLDVEQPEILSGRELIEKGLKVDIPNKPGAVVVRYRKTD